MVQGCFIDGCGYLHSSPASTGFPLLSSYLSLYLYKFVAIEPYAYARCTAINRDVVSGIITADRLDQESLVSSQFAYLCSMLALSFSTPRIQAKRDQESCLESSTPAQGKCLNVDIGCLCSNVGYIDVLACCLSRNCNAADQQGKSSDKMSLISTA